MQDNYTISIQADHVIPARKYAKEFCGESVEAVIVDKIISGMSVRDTAKLVNLKTELVDNIFNLFLDHFEFKQLMKGNRRHTFAADVLEMIRACAY